MQPRPSSIVLSVLNNYKHAQITFFISYNLFNDDDDDDDDDDVGDDGDDDGEGGWWYLVIVLDAWWK